VRSNTLTTVVRYTNMGYQIDTMAVLNMVDHTGDRVLMSRVTCAHAHNYTETHEC